MTIFYRLKRLIQSDVHALIAGLEEPKLILEQSLRDMQDELAKSDAGLRECESTLKAAIKKQEELANGIKDIEGKIAMALGEKKEEAARFFIKKQILCKKQGEVLQKDILKLREALEALRLDFQNKQNAYNDVMKKKDEIVWQQELQNPAFAAASNFSVPDCEIEHEVELEWLKRMKMVKE